MHKVWGWGVLNPARGGKSRDRWILAATWPVDRNHLLETMSLRNQTNHVESNWERHLTDFWCPHVYADLRVHANTHAVHARAHTQNV